MNGGIFISSGWQGASGGPAHEGGEVLRHMPPGDAFLEEIPATTIPKGSRVLSAVVSGVTRDKLPTML